jgi:hypothetical protein
MGYDINKYTDIIPSILKVLQRLHDKGHVDIGTPSGGGRKLYLWSPIQPIDSKGNLNSEYAIKLGLDAVGAPHVIDPFVGKGSLSAQFLKERPGMQPLKERPETILKGKPKTIMGKKK